MNTPPFLIGATLLFWGAQAGWLWLGALVAVVLESPRYAKNRFHFTQADLDRIWNLCFVLLFGALVIAFVTSDGAAALTTVANNNSISNRIDALNKGGRSVILVLLWLPLIYLPIAVAQAFSDQARMDWSTFSWWLRQQRSREMGRPGGSGLNVSWPYFAVCLLATSAANQRTYTFPAVSALLVAWALWNRRAAGGRLTPWLASLGLVLGIAFAAQLGMLRLQGLMQRLDSALIARFASGRGFDPKEVRTALGAIGRMKLSSSIVLRVAADGAPPPLLREASYKLFLSPSWAATKQNFNAVIPESDLTTWKLLPDKPTRKWAVVSGFLSGGQGLLPVPHGAARLEDLPAVQFETNALGAMRILEGPGFYQMAAYYDEGQSIDSPPDDLDREVPHMDQPAIERLVDELGLRDMPVATALKTLNQFFAKGFQYSSWVEEPRRRRVTETPLTRFLTKTRSGHCEYFATATVLMLRAAGIPARYAVGYSIQEYNGTEWIVRERHAHAWCLAWVDGAWHDVDNTPGSWVRMERSHASSWDKISDAWSNIWFAFSRWRWGKGEWKAYLLWLVVPLILLVGWRLLAQKQWIRAKHASGTRSRNAPVPGADSEFYRIEAALKARGLERRADETMSAWTRRVAFDDPNGAADLAPLVGVHYRLRFDPGGLDESSRARFRVQVNEWLLQHQAAASRTAAKTS